ncbi:MAG: glutaredoxin [Phycisphaerales bacterium]|nr:glutaredoxin [Phycisphaerales bacterium]
MAVWYYSIDGQQSGPSDERQVRALVASGKIKGEDLVWKEGTPEWVPANTVAELKPTSRLAPLPAAPLPAGAPMPVGALAVGMPAPGQPIQLAYAAPVVAPLPVIGNDEGPFLKLGKMFSVPGGRWTGMAVVSPRAVYLLKVTRSASGAAYGVGGLAGVLLHQAFSKVDDVRTCSADDLPHPIRVALDPKNKRGKCDVVILPREAMSLVKLGSINNQIAFHLRADRFSVTTNLFGGGKIRRFLTGYGWTLNQVLNPTAEPVHGQGMGREFHEMGKQGPSTFKRVALAIIGILLVILIIVARIMRNF